MELYVRFMMSLTFGLIGVGLVLKVLLDNLFNDWDAFTDLSRAFSDFWHGRRLVRLDKPEDILSDRVAKDQPMELTTRRIDQRREELRTMSEVENRIGKPSELSESWTTT